MIAKPHSGHSLPRFQIFFAVHLFREQIFSMSDQVEMYLYDFLLVNRRECCDPKAQKKYNTNLKQNNGCPVWIQLCHLAGHHTQPPHNKAWWESKRIFERQMLEWWADSNGTTGTSTFMNWSNNKIADAVLNVNVPTQWTN